MVRAIVAAFLACVTTSAAAQTAQPAETPPATFTGTEYVDSRGCVFVRAGIDGAPVWVPRVNSRRQQICGQPPSVPGQVQVETQIATATDPGTARGIGLHDTAPVAAQTRVAAAPQVTHQAVPVRRSAVTQRAPAAAAPAPVPVVRFPNRRFVTEDGRRISEIPANAIIIPRHIYEAQLSKPAGSKTPPAGFRAAWTDDRLNPKRAHQRAYGLQQQDAVWSSGVPRQPVRRKVGDVPVGAVSDEAQTGAQISTKSAPGRFVQAGAYTSRAEAKAAAQQLARTGMTVRLGLLRKGGQETPIVLVGPFSDTRSARQALRTAKAAGFAGAFLRR